VCSISSAHATGIASSSLPPTAWQAARAMAGRSRLPPAKME
jgi:hypothetical protein